MIKATTIASMQEICTSNKVPKLFRYTLGECIVEQDIVRPFHKGSVDECTKIKLNSYIVCVNEGVPSIIST